MQALREHGAQLLLVACLLAFAVYALTLPERPLFWISVIIPLLGALRLRGAPPVSSALAYLFGLLALTSLTHMIFFGDDRYHLAVSPALCILAAAAFRPRAKPASASNDVRQTVLSASPAAE
jgi:FtsH-binding integral membrane protein